METNLIEPELSEEESDFAESFAFGMDHLERNATRYGMALGTLIVLAVLVAGMI